MEIQLFQMKYCILSRVFLAMLMLVVLFEVHSVSGADKTSKFPRLRCFRDEQPDCNEEFIDVYPELSKSANGMVNATTWFLLYTRRNRDHPELLHRCGGRLPPNSTFNPKKRLILNLTPYNTAYCDVAIYREWTEQFLEREDANVLVIDYGWGNHLDYGLSLENVKIVAEQTVVVLRNIQNDTELSSKQMYLVGHSLGAQLAGLIGKVYFNQTGSLIHRITGLDPAGPGYPESVPLSDRLDRSDAALVDVWHTNTGDCLPFLGIDYDAGDADFYINDGKNQPACQQYALISVAKGDLIYGISDLLMSSLCSHAHSTQYFKVSTNPGRCQYVGVECDSYEAFKNGSCSSCGDDGSKCAIMGYDFEDYFVQRKNHHKYYVSTSLQCPYCDNSHIQLDGFAKTYKQSLQ